MEHRAAAGRPARRAGAARHRPRRWAARRRDPGLRQRQLRDQLAQPCLSHGHRAPGCETGRSAAQRQTSCRWLAARHRGVLHPRHRVAGRAQQPAIPLGIPPMKRSPVSLGIVGARGHTGSELIRMIQAHPGFELAFVSSRELDGQRVADHNPGYAGELRFESLGADAVAAKGADAVILALPNGKAAPFVAALDAARPDTVIVDLSADYRFDEGWYYGLPELTRARGAGQSRISNPGCYATAMQLAITPLLDRLAGPPQCFGVSGYSGAG